jgi:hypothetical protein
MAYTSPKLRLTPVIALALTLASANFTGAQEKYRDDLSMPAYSLPDPLVLKNGQKVTSAEMWWKQRRPEIVEDFDREIYGRVPTETPIVKWEVTNTTEGKNGDVELKTGRSGSLTGSRRHLNVRPCTESARDCALSLFPWCSLSF